jgi:hypothetical protein
MFLIYFLAKLAINAAHINVPSIASILENNFDKFLYEDMNQTLEYPFF